MNGQRWITVGVVLGLLLLVFGLLLPAIHDAREAARKSTSKNNMKQIGLALDNYHSSFRALPVGGIIAEDGTPMHGWMSLILPYTEASPDFNMINFAETWDTPENQNIYERPKYQYEIPGVDARFTSAGFALTHYLGNPNVLHQNSHVAFEDMQDGKTNSWLAGEVMGHFQPWGYPFNWRRLGTRLCNGPDCFGHAPWDGGHLLMADGNVVFYSQETSPEILKQLMNAPPVPTSEQTETPGTRFETDDIQRYEVELQSDPEGRYKYYARVLQNSEKKPVRLEVFSLLDVEKIQSKEVDFKRFPYSEPLFRVDRSTDIAARINETSLAEDASPEQIRTNVKTLQDLQKRLRNE